MTARESVVHSNIPNPLPSNSSFSEVLAVKRGKEIHSAWKPGGMRGRFKTAFVKTRRMSTVHIQKWTGASGDQGSCSAFPVYHWPPL